MSKCYQLNMNVNIVNEICHDNQLYEKVGSYEPTL